MARTTFSGPVASDNGFEGDITAVNVTVTTLEFTGAAATASNAAAFSATRILTVTADGVTYYIPAATATW